jgi:hypothetical protein
MSSGIVYNYQCQGEKFFFIIKKGKTNPRSQQLEKRLQVLCRLHLRRGGQLSLSRPFNVLCGVASNERKKKKMGISTLTGTFGHAFAPFLEHPLEGIVDNRVQLIRVRLDECHVEHRNLTVARRRLVLLLSLAHVGSSVGVAVPHQPFGALDVLQRLSEVVLPAHALVAFLLDELQSTQAQTAVLVRLPEQPNRLPLGTQSAYGLFVGYVECYASGRGRCTCCTRACASVGGWRGGRAWNVG